MHTLIAVVIVSGVALLWSLVGPFTRMSTTDIPTTLFWRSLSGAVCIFLFYIFISRKNHIRLRPFSFNRGEIIVALIMAIAMFFFISAFFFTSIANVTFVYGTVPMMTCVLSLFILREKINFLSCFCCIFAFIGVALIIGNPQRLSGDVTGIILALIMTFLMALLTVSFKFFSDANPLKVTYLGAFLLAIVMIPFSSFRASRSGGLWLACYEWWPYGRVGIL